MQAAPQTSGCINVPQGRVARIDTSSTRRDINSSFTGQVGNCTAVALLGKERFSLCHLDSVSYLPVVRNEAEWAGRGVRIIVLYHQSSPAAPEKNEKLTRILDSDEVKLEFHCMNEEEAGIQLFSEHNPQLLHGHLSLLKKTLSPENLWRHPQELQIKTARVVNQLFAIGNKEGFSQREIVFDGQCWQAIPKEESRPYCRSAVETRYLSSLKPNMKPRQFLMALLQIARNIQAQCQGTFAMTPENFALMISYDAQMYANQFDHVKLFKACMIECIEERQNPEVLIGDFDDFGPVDKDHFDQMHAALKEPGDSYPKVAAIISAYRRAVQTRAGQQCIAEFEQHEVNYLEGQMYAACEAKMCSSKKEGAKWYREGNNHYSSGDFLKALEAHQKCLNIYEMCYEASDENLATAYCSLGKTFHRLGRADEAIAMLQIAEQLCRCNPSADPKKLEHYQTSLRVAKRQKGV